MSEACKVIAFQKGEKIREWWSAMPVRGCFSIALDNPLARQDFVGGWGNFAVTMDSDEKGCSQSFIDCIAADPELSQALLRDGMLRLELEAVCQDENKWWECIYVCQCNEAGRVIGITGSQTLSHEHSHHEQSVSFQNAEEARGDLLWERKLFIAGPVIIFRWRADEQWTVEYVSPNIGQFGYRQDDIISGKLAYTSIIHPDDLQRAKTEVREFTESGEPFFQHYYRIVRADGNIRWVCEFTSAVWDDLGQTTHYDGYIFDISQVKAMESALRDSEELFSKAFRLSPALMMISSAEDGRVMEINDTALRVLNVAREDVIGKPLPNIDWMFCNRRASDKALPDAQSGEAVTNEEQKFCDRDGSVRIGLFSVEPVEIGNHRCTLTVISDITERKQVEEQIHYQAYHDLLTGLPNRRMFEERLTGALAQARQDKESIAVIFTDLDGFKKVNDSLGHQAGDHLLRDVATRLAYTVREGDMVARLGGDEFMLMLFGVRNAAEVEPIANRILDVCSQPFNLQGHTASVTASVGINFYPADGLDIQTLMKNADIAMYRAKELGRNRIAYFSAPTELAKEQAKGADHA